MKQKKCEARERKSIFRSIFIPLFLIMLVQAAIFYLVAVYGGVEESLSQNAADILYQRLYNRKNELETQLVDKCFDLEACAASIQGRYEDYEKNYGQKPLTDDQALQIQFLLDCSDGMVNTLRQNEVNGIFLILNDKSGASGFDAHGEKKYGLCIRDMDQDSNYSGREDLLLERSPSSMVDPLGCSLDSWWEAWYTFDSQEGGDYYYSPLNAAWENPGADGADLAYLSGLHRLSGSDKPVISYSIPLISEDGYPYGVVGVELTSSYLDSLLPISELGSQSGACYVLALREAGTDVCKPIVGSGALYTRCFDSGSPISSGGETPTGGFTVTGRGNTVLYGDDASINVYNNNNPFEHSQLVLLAMVEKSELFAYVGHIKTTLLLVSLLSLALGVGGIFWVSRRFAAPITALAKRVSGMEPQKGVELGRLGITEIDQLVDSIEELNRNVSRSSARTEFFSRMSHDMRTPMNAIISFSSPELLEGVSEAEKDDYLQKIHASGDYLLGLINEVLDMTKIESNKIELHPAGVPAERLCDTTIPIIEKLAQKKNVELSCDIKAEPGVCVMVDAQYFDQILMNLLSNAVKFTPEGGLVELSLHVEDAGNGGLACRIVVADTGIGMSEEFMKNLYVPFEQEHSTKEGTGLGLSIVKKLVELMGGSVNCVSHLGEGTVFTVELPLERGEAEAVRSESDAELKGLEGLRGKRLLVCEDNSLNSQIVCHLMDRYGVMTEVAENGRKGVDMFSASEAGWYDAVLMDIRMPVMDGLTAARAIRALPRMDAAAVPIIAMTANAFAEDIRNSREAGMNEHLAKPIDTKKFFKVLLKYLCPPERR